MSLTQAKKQYDAMLKSGELLELFPMLTGDWQEDKEVFLDMFYLNDDILSED